MPAFKFTVARTAIIEERYTIEADSEEQALAIAFDGAIDYDNDQVSTEFIDWHDDEWSITNKEDLCPLIKMVREYDPVN